MWASGRAGQPVQAAAGLTGHSGSQPRHFGAGFGSAVRNTKREHVASFKLMAVKIHQSRIFLFFREYNHFPYLCTFSAGLAFVIAKDLASKDSERKMSLILPMQNNTNYAFTAWHFGISTED